MKKLNLALAILISAEAHLSQIDKCGKPYIIHPLAVMNETLNRYPEDEELACCAVLHDVVEDADWFLEILEENNQSFPYKKPGITKITYTIANPKWGPIEISKRQYNCINALTHIGNSRSDTYDKYISNLMENIDSMIIKLFDLEQNTKVTRMIGTTEKDINRLEKYFKNYEKIKNKLEKINKNK
jgi:(p)ppGpp synthase/HD superfamily hydrolase